MSFIAKAVTKQEAPKMFLAAPKMVSFSQLLAVKKDTIFVAARKIFGPSYLVTALVVSRYIQTWSLDLSLDW